MNRCQYCARPFRDAQEIHEHECWHGQEARRNPEYARVTSWNNKIAHALDLVHEVKTGLQGRAPNVGPALLHELFKLACDARNDLEWIIGTVMSDAERKFIQEVPRPKDDDEK